MAKVPYHIEISATANKFAMYHGFDASGREYYAAYGIEHPIGIYKGETPTGAIYLESGTYAKVSLKVCFPNQSHYARVCQDASYVIKVDTDGRDTYAWIPRVVGFYGEPVFEVLKSYWDFFKRYIKDVVATTNITVYDWWGNVVFQDTNEPLYAAYPPLYDNYPYEQLPTPPNPPPQEEMPPPPPPAPAKVTLTIVAHEGGTTNPAPGTYQYDAGSTVTITAIPNTGYVFNHWLVNGAKRTENPLTLTLDTDKMVEAYFAQAPPPPPTPPTPPSAPTPRPLDYILGTLIATTPLLVIGGAIVTNEVSRRTRY